MTYRDERKIAYKLLSILQEYAPDQAGQQSCTELYNSLPHANVHEQVRHLACALVDGLQYGNWPWVKPGEPA